MVRSRTVTSLALSPADEEALARRPEGTPASTYVLGLVRTDVVRPGMWAGEPVAVGRDEEVARLSVAVPDDLAHAVQRRVPEGVAFAGYARALLRAVGAPDQHDERDRAHDDGPPDCPPPAPTARRPDPVEIPQPPVSVERDDGTAPPERPHGLFRTVGSTRNARVVYVDGGLGDDDDAAELVAAISRCAVDRVSDELDAELAAPFVVPAEGVRYALGWHHLDGPRCMRLAELERIARAFAHAIERTAEIALERREVVGRLVVVEHAGRRWPVLDVEVRRLARAAGAPRLRAVAVGVRG